MAELGRALRQVYRRRGKQKRGQRQRIGNIWERTGGNRSGGREGMGGERSSQKESE